VLGRSVVGGLDWRAEDGREGRAEDVALADGVPPDGVRTKWRNILAKV